MKRTIQFLLAATLVFSLVGTESVSAAGENGGWKLKFVMNADSSGSRSLYPASMFVDESTQRYYVVDSGNNRLLSFDNNGKALRSFDAGGKLNKPVSMAKNDAGVLLVLEKGNDGLTQIDLGSKSIKTTVIRHQGRSVNPQKIRYFKGGSYLLSKSGGMIIALSGSGDILQQYTCNSCVIGFIDFQLTGNNLMALTQQEGEIYSFDLEGKLLKKIQLNPKPAFPISFAVSREGNIFVLERHAGHISIYDGRGQLLDSIFAKGEKLGSLSYPIEVQFDPWGRLCIVEEGNGRVSVFEQ